MAMPGNPKNSSQRATSKVGTLEAAHPSWLRARPEVKGLHCLGTQTNPQRRGFVRNPNELDRLVLPKSTIDYKSFLPLTKLKPLLTIFRARAWKMTEIWYLPHLAVAQRARSL